MGNSIIFMAKALASIPWRYFTVHSHALCLATSKVVIAAINHQKAVFLSNVVSSKLFFAILCAFNSKAVSGLNMSTDSLFAKPLEQVSAFQFDDDVAEVFPDMIHRSVPGYTEILSMLGKLSKRFGQTDANYYDLGCSLGAATHTLRSHISAAGGKIYAVDNSQSMLSRCEKHVRAFNYPIPVFFLLRDIQSVPIENAAIVVLNFTLQFLSPAERFTLLKKIYQGLNPNGLLFISEKIKFQNPKIDDLCIQLHHEFKKENGYSALEISQKRAALENVLVPDTLETHCQRFTDAGFKQHCVWYQNMNFVSMLAIK